MADRSGKIQKKNEAQHDKTYKYATHHDKMHSANTQISMDICPFWSESLLYALRTAKDPCLLHAHYAGRTYHTVGFIVLWLKYYNTEVYHRYSCVLYLFIDDSILIRSENSSIKRPSQLGIFTLFPRTQRTVISNVPCSSKFAWICPFVNLNPMP